MKNTKSCLLIDDDHDDQLVFSLAVKEFNQSILCLTADSGRIALAQLESTEPALMPDLIFLDLNLPGINGYECLALLKQNPKLTHIPVVIYSTSAREADIIKTKDLGAVGFITKPLQITDLIKRLEKFL